MRRTTAALLLTLSVFIATPSNAAVLYRNYDRDSDRGFGARIRAAIHRITHYIAPNVDWLTPPKP